MGYVLDQREDTRKPLTGQSLDQLLLTSIKQIIKLIVMCINDQFVLDNEKREALMFPP